MTRHFLMAIVLIALPVAVFFGIYRWQYPPATAGLGDMSTFAAIVAEVQSIADKGNLPAAAGRIRDLEAAWDEGEATLQPANPAQWGAVDDAIDMALKSLRAGTPDVAAVGLALASLQTVLADPALATGTAVGASSVAGVAVTDETGHALPCETMLAMVHDKLAGTAWPAEKGATVADLLAKATERCNADDDKTADTFSAQALAALGQ